MNNGRSAKEMTEQPPCDCHGTAMVWNRRSDLVAGGYWRCRERYKAKAKAWRTANRDRLLAYMTEWRASKPEHWKRYMRLYRYGLTHEAYTALFESQGGRCALCDIEAAAAPRGALQIDHDHATGRVRGLVCFRCNTALERLDVPEWLSRAAAYLERTKESA